MGSEMCIRDRADASQERLSYAGLRSFLATGSAVSWVDAQHEKGLEERPNETLGADRVEIFLTNTRSRFRLVPCACKIKTSHGPKARNFASPSARGRALASVGARS